MRRFHRSRAAMPLAAAMLAHPALAQEVRGPESPAETSDAPSPASTATVTPPQATPPAEATGLGEVVVTARRVAENLQDVAVAVTAYSGEDLQKQNASRVADTALLVPSFFLQPDSTGGAIALMVRGQVQVDYPATLDPSVGTYVDGLYWARANGLNGDLLDIQSVQVLKGPQGTLFGRNTTGGAFLLQTNDPQLRGATGLVSATYGRFDERGATGILNLPLVDDRLAVRLAVVGRKRDGYIDNTFNGIRQDTKNSVTGRGKILFKPYDELSLLLSAEYFRSNERPQPVRLGYVGPVGVQGPGTGLFLLSYARLSGLDPVSAKAAADAYIASTEGTDAYASDTSSKTFIKTQTYTGTATHDTVFGAVKFIGGYRLVQLRQPSDFDGTPFPIFAGGPIPGFDYEQNLKQYSGELQITGKAFDDAVDFAAGALYFKETGRDSRASRSLRPFNPLIPQIFQGDIDADNAGVYGQATWRVTDKIALTGGLRYSEEAKGVTLFNRSILQPAGVVLCSIRGAVAPTCAARRSSEFSSLSWTAGVDYKPVEDILLYVKASKGFRSGGQNLRAQGTGFIPYDPEIAYSYEGGIKSEFLDRRLRLNLAGYYTDVDDVQRTVTVAGGAGIDTIIGNAAKVRIYGGEAELSALVATGLRLGATGAITRPKYLRYLDGARDRSNDRFTLVPRYSFTLSGDYGTTVGSVGLNAHVDYAYIGRTPLGPDPFDPGNPEGRRIIRFTTTPPQGILNARVSATFADDRYEVALYGRNLTDNRDVSYGVNLAAPLNFVVYQRREPATYGVTATVKFGQF